MIPKKAKESFEAVRRETPKSLGELEKLPVHELLLLLGGFLAMGLGVLVFILQVAIGRRILEPIFELIINLLFGFVLLSSFVLTRSNLTNGAILGIVASVVLLVLGGTAGIVGGIFGLAGAVVALAISEGKRS